LRVVGFFRERVLGLESPAPAAKFDVTIPDDAAVAFGLEASSSPIAYAPRVERRTALQVPAVKRAHDLIAGTLGGLPLNLYGPDNTPLPSTFLAQPEVACPRSVSMTRLVADMLFDEVGWWRITRRLWNGYPYTVERLSPRRVVVNKGRVWVDGKVADDADLIRFDSPFPGLLRAGARAIRTALILDAAAARYADGAPPADYFTPAEGVDPGTDEDIAALLDDWKTARQTRSTAYVPAALNYNTAGWSPDKLQLADARQHAVLEIARCAGIDPEEVGVAVTSRTYANSFDRRKTFIDMTLGGYRQAIEDRLGMRDVTPLGQSVRFDLSAFLRSDDLTRMSVYKAGLEVGVYADVAEVRAAEGRPPLDAAEPAAPTPLRSVPTATPGSAANA
jgi:hypothetical protein